MYMQIWMSIALDNFFWNIAKFNYEYCLTIYVLKFLVEKSTEMHNQFSLSLLIYVIIYQ